MTRREESEPALISVKFSFLLRLSEVKYHWSKSGKGDKTVNLLCFTRSDQIPRESVIYGGFNSQHGARRTVGCVYLLRASKVPVCFRVKILFEEGAGR